MGTFNKLKRSRKSSHLDEKIEFLNKELEKTGVILETPANSTASIYNTTEFVPGLPQITSQVPDATGFSNGDSQDANGGDESNPDTWEDGWNNITDMKNPNNLNGVTNRNIPITPSFEDEHGELLWVPVSNGSPSGHLPSVAGGGGLGVWTISAGIGGGKSIGTVSAGNEFVQILIPDNIFGSYNYPSWPKQGWASGGYYGGYSDKEYQAARNVAIDYQYHRYNSSWVSRKCWVPYGQATSHGGPSYAEYDGPKKTTVIKNFDGTDRTLYWRLKDVSICTYTSNYISQDGTPDARTTMFRTGLDDGEYYPGSMSGFMDFLRGALGVSKEALEWLFEWLQDNNIAGGLPYGTPGADDPFQHDDIDDDDLLDDSDFDMSDWEFAFAEIEDDMENDSSSDSSPFDEPASDANTGWVNPGDEVAWGGGKSKEEKALEKKFNYWNNTAKYNNKQKGDNAAAMIQMGMGIPVDSFTQTFGITPTEWQNPANWLPDGKPNPNGPAWNKYKNEKYEPQGDLISEGWESPKHVGIDKDEKKRWF